jgi:hypothetical protein
MALLDNRINFRSLSLKDLLDARDAYHWHLMNKANVVGTAVGLYLIRKKESEGKARTFDNSEVRPNSWPCILVLVDHWIDATDFGPKGVDPNHLIPRTLFLPDGRAAPVCVVHVKPGTPQPGAPSRTRWPETYLGGGCPIVANVQQSEHSASIGCLVTDGHKTYALTNRHVSGEEGSILYGNLRGNLVPVGRTSGKQLTRLSFSQVFPAYVGTRTYLTIDIGLVEVDCVDDWTNRPFGLPGVVGPVADLNEANIGLQLIDAPVKAFGAASGLLLGSIKALFYRYKAMAGYEYVSEFLIAPDDGVTQTQRGDSGTVWYLYDRKVDETKQVLRPVCVEWGAQATTAASGSMNFALASGLSTACQLLDVDLVREGDTGATPFWGQTGHYSIATAAIDALSKGPLKDFLAANIDQISFRPNQLTPDQIRKALAKGDFVELADVPDLVWKKVAADVPGGRDYARNAGPEHPNHYADIDQPDKKGGPNLRDLTLKKIDNMSVDVWTKWYRANGQTDTRHQGLLPFRVWQLFDVMVKALKAPKGADLPHFLCAAGIVSHYVGDACQPLHGSYHADGFAERSQDGGKHWPGKGVHSAYEDKMVDTFSAKLLPKIGPATKSFNKPIRAIANGQDAAFATVQLMAYAASIIAPDTLCNAYIKLGGGTSKPVIQGLWDEFGDDTANVMGAGARYLAALWQGAYAAAKKPTLAKKAIDQKALAKIYQDDTFAPSLTLDKISPEL